MNDKGVLICCALLVLAVGWVISLPFRANRQMKNTIHSGTRDMKSHLANQQKEEKIPLLWITIALLLAVLIFGK